MNHKAEATALIKSKPGKEAELKSAILDLIEETVKEPGCELFKIFQNESNPQEFTLWEIFTDQSALQEHLQKSYTLNFFALELTESISAIHHRQLSR